MAPRIFLSQIKDFVGQKVEISGWLFNKRSSGGIQFLEIRDGTGSSQATLVKNKADKALFEEVDSLTLESSLRIQGRVRQDPRAPGGLEVEIEKLEIIQRAEDNYPLGKKEHGSNFLLNHRHLWLRSRRQWAVQRIRHEIVFGLLDFYRARGFVRIDAPIFTPTACEGTTSLFEVDYFGKPAFLSQSGQLYLEAAIFGFNRVFDFAPVFRAEKSKTRRHLIEFWMTDAELAFVEHEENMRIQEEMITFVLKRVLENCSLELKILKRNSESLEKATEGPFLRMSYEEALTELGKLGSDIVWGQDLGGDDETLLTKAIAKPIFVQFYPARIKAFYMKRHPQEKSLVLNDDLLAPEGYGEIIGGSQREDDYDVLLKSIKDHDLSLESFNWYLDLRRFGSVPHSGFGLGIERLVAWICGLKHIRETIPFPRLLNRCYP